MTPGHVSHCFHLPDTLFLVTLIRLHPTRGTVLIEMAVVERLYQARRELLNTGASITQATAQYGVDGRTLHRWITRYFDGGLESADDRCRLPVSSQHTLRHTSGHA